MNTDVLECYENFRKSFREGPQPLVNLEVNQALNPLVANYIDASTFGSWYDLLAIGKQLNYAKGLSEAARVQLHNNFTLISLLMGSSPEALEKLKGDKQLLAPLQSLLSNELVSDSDLEKIPDPLFRNQVKIWQRGQELAIKEDKPFYPVSWKGETPELTRDCALLLDPLDIDWEKILQPIEGHNVLFLFPNHQTFWHCLQFDALFKLLKEKPFRILNRPYKEPLEWIPKDLIFFCQRAPWINQKNNLLTALKKGPKTLFTLGKNLAARDRILHCGKERLPATMHSQPVESISEWKSFVKHLPRIATRRSLPDKGPHVLTHVCGSIYDAENIETARITELLRKCDRKKFTPLLFLTEIGMVRPTEYPQMRVDELPSAKRAMEQLEVIHDLKVELFLSSGRLPYLKAAEEIAERLQERSVGIVVFHGNNVIHEMAAQICDVPLRILVREEKGATPPAYSSVVHPSEELDAKIEELVRSN
jgi:hypothetical protein